MNYVILSLISMFVFGLAVFFYKLATPHMDSVSLVLLVYIIATFFTASVWFFTPEKTITITGVKYSFLSASLAFIGMIAMISALKIGPVNIVSPIRNLSLVIAIILAMVFLGEKMTLTRGLGILFAAMSIVLLSIQV